MRETKGTFHDRSKVLYQQADALEKKGDIAGATDAYLKAQGRQKNREVRQRREGEEEREREREGV